MVEIPDESRTAIAGRPGGPWLVVMRIFATVVIVALVLKFDLWVRTHLPGVPRWVIFLCLIGGFISLLLLGLAVERAFRACIQRLAPTWLRLRGMFDQWEARFDTFLARLADRWLFGVAFAALGLSALSAWLGARFNVLPGEGFVSPQSLLFLGFLLASTAIGLCKQIKARVWVSILFLAGLFMWCFSASIG